MPTLLECLADLRNPDLSWRVKMLEPKLKLTAKPHLTKAITAALLGPRLQQIYLTLSKVEQTAVAEAVHSPLFRHNPQMFLAKHGTPAVFSVARDDGRSSYHSEGSPTRLGLFLFPEPRAHGRCIPADMANLLLDFVPEPPPAAIKTLAEPPKPEGHHLRETEPEALNEVLLLLRLAETGGLTHTPSTGFPTAGSLRPMLSLLPGGDWFPAEVIFQKPAYQGAPQVGAIKPVAWIRLLMVAGYITLRGSKSALTESGRRISKQQPWDIIAQIWHKWAGNKDFDEFNRIDLIKGQSTRNALTARQPRRSIVVQALEECPTGQWITLKEFSRFMQAEGHDFDISQNSFSLYIHEKRYGSLGYDGGDGWEMLQERYIACLLMEYAATLGLVDICYLHPADSSSPSPGWVDVEWISRYDGLLAFRVTPLGRYCLSPEKGPFTPSKPPSTLRLEAKSNLTIHVVSGTPGPADLIQIEAWAEPKEPNVWQADSERALASVEAGRDPAEFAAYLQERDEQPLPEKFEAFLKKATSDGRALRRGEPAQLFHCRDAATATLIVTSLSSICQKAGDSTLVVPESKLDAFRKRVRSFGYGIQ
ncbi:MAG: hypothetical protein Q8M07_16020 [Prosthecobacter sp.]|nr:hypothetical protein [Prosthecobacter sp.]